MSASEVKLESDDPLAELSVVDSHYRLQARSVGTLTHALPAGLYIAQSRSGDKTQQRPLRLKPHENVLLRFEGLGDLRSSASDAVVPASAGEHWFVLAIRPSDASTTSNQLLYGFQLCTSDGKVLEDFAQHSPIPVPS